MSAYQLGGGNITLGCLLGQYDGTQSFDISSKAMSDNAVNSWINQNEHHCLFYFSGAGGGAVHSSDQGLSIQTDSDALGRDALMRYPYGKANDAYARWSPDVTTHDVRCDLYARETTGLGNLFVSVSIDNKARRFIDSYASMLPYRIETFTTSSYAPGVSPFLDFDVDSPNPNAFTFIVDDVLTQIDPITLHPEYGFQDQQRLQREDTRTRGGNLHTWAWAKHGAWKIPLPFLSSSHAALVNWWWENNFNLAFTLNTSDTESIHIVRITNDRAPIDTLVSPYNNQWKGALMLETIKQGGRVF